MDLNRNYTSPVHEYARVCKGPSDGNFIIRAYMRKLCVDVCVPPIFLCPLHYSKPQNMSVYAWNASSERIPKRSINRTAVCPWCLQLSVNASILQYIKALSLVTKLSYKHILYLCINVFTN